jgi:hypothetical protein
MTKPTTLIAHAWNVEDVQLQKNFPSGAEMQPKQVLFTQSKMILIID